MYKSFSAVIFRISTCIDIDISYYFWHSSVPRINSFRQFHYICILVSICSKVKWIINYTRYIDLSVLHVQNRVFIAMMQNLLGNNFQSIQGIFHIWSM